MTRDFVLPEGLISESELRAALGRQCEAKPDLLPADPADAAVVSTNRFNSVTKATLGAAYGGLRIPSRPAVAAQKSQLATRPVLPLSLPERALFDTILTKLGTQLDDVDLTDDPTSVTFRDLQQRPIETSAAWVVGADVNSYYQYVDHQILLDQLVGRTGEWGLANALHDMLHSVIGRSAGLPQGFRPMGLLGGLYLSSCVRALRRAGYGAWSYSDDLRITCASRREAHESITVLDDALRELGLSLNTEKCWIRSGQEYADWAARPEQLLRRFEEQHMLISLWELAGPYPEDVIAEMETVPEPSEADTQGTVSLIFEWAEQAQISRSGASGWTDRVVLTQALRAGANVREPAGLASLPKIVEAIPQLTNEIAQYLRAVRTQDEEATATSLQQIGDPDLPLSDWQLAWLSWSATGMAQVPSNLINRCHATYANRRFDVPWAWCAALLLGQEGVTAGDLVTTLNQISSAVARDIVIASLVASPGLRVKESLAESAHERAIIAAGPLV